MGASTTPVVDSGTTSGPRVTAATSTTAALPLTRHAIRAITPKTRQMTSALLLVSEKRAPRGSFAARRGSSPRSVNCCMGRHLEFHPSCAGNAGADRTPLPGAQNPHPILCEFYHIVGASGLAQESGRGESQQEHSRRSLKKAAI